MKCFTIITLLAVCLLTPGKERRQERRKNRGESEEPPRTDKCYMPCMMTLSFYREKYNDHDRAEKVGLLCVFFSRSDFLFRRLRSVSVPGHELVQELL
ncbi:hypothetical protein Y032_0411g963 [Ancylostoma ceylanicum]|uniref:Uncharacterized protein n=1 Tax=Ancylostoma ceylanicum TaxID=53326 RepID=A0A016X294_9BILA|nr:hypothetical protein Y032_0411g963 [Ancylostoma ceylanicum]